MPTSSRSLLICLVLLSACATDPPLTEGEGAEPLSASTAIQLDWLADREVHEPRLVLDRAGTLLLVWRQKAEEGSDLFVARRGEDGVFGEPVQVNDEAGTVASYPHDEVRPAVATGPDGRLAVAWSDSRGQIRAAESTDGGATFAPSLRLEQVEEPAYRGFAELVYDDTGTLHAVWIDSRFAGGFAEEPADLFYGRVVEGQVTEWNLTADQEPTVCGCCRPSIEMTDDGEPRMVFRNATADGYRDIFTLTGSIDSGFSQPKRVGHPLWKLQGCPMSGPTTLAGSVSWSDASSGRKRLMTADYDSTESVPLLDQGDDDWVPRLSPRPVSSSNPGTEWLLLPGQSSSRLVVRSEDRWLLAVEDLPAWASSAHFENGALLLIGAVSGEVKMLRQPVSVPG